MDLIDRQKATDKIIARYPDSDATQYNIGYADAINDVLKDIRYMPSAEPEIIRCKDCKYFERYTDDGTFESVLKMHQWDGECSEWVGHTYMGWFCSRAERRTDEADYRKE